MTDQPELKPCSALTDRCVEDKDTGCLVWQGSTNGARNYGKLHFKGKLSLAHRASYEMSKGKIPDGLVIDHLCRNTLCINPDHLELIESCSGFTLSSDPRTLNNPKIFSGSKSLVLIK